MAEEIRHFTEINNTATNLSTNLDVNQLGLQTDGSKLMVYKDAAGALHIVQNQNADATFLDVDTRNLIVNTGYALTLADITPGYVLFGGAGGVVSGEANLFWDAANNRLGIGTDTPGATLEIVGGIGQSAVIDHGLTSLLPTNAYMLTGIIESGVGGLKVIGATQTGYHGALELWGAFGGTLPIDEFPIVKIVGCKKGSPDTTVTALGATNTVFQIANYTTPLVSVLGSGYIEVAPGDTRVLKVGQSASGAGDPFVISAGAAKTGSYSGGDLYLRAGAKGGSGEMVANGIIYIGDSNTSYIHMGVDARVPYLRALTTDGLGISDISGKLGVFVEDGGNVGIGTSNPTQKLQVNLGANSGAILLCGKSDNTITGSIVYSNGNGCLLELKKEDASSSVYLSSYEDSYLTGGKLGIGTNSPSGTLHVKTSDCGRSPDSAADDFVVEVDGDGGMSILTAATSTANIWLGELTDNNVGTISFNGSTRFLTLSSGLNPVLNIAADGVRLSNTPAHPDSGYWFQIDNSSSMKAKAYAWDTYACSEQWKKNIAPVENASDKLKNLNGITFVHDKPDTPEINGKEGIGITAESLEALGLPGLVTKSETGEYTGINLTNLIPVLVEAVKALTGRIETLEGAKP